MLRKRARGVPRAPEPFHGAFDQYPSGLRRDARRMLLAMAMTPHNLMARTHDVFNIDKHLPTQFGDWSRSRA